MNSQKDYKQHYTTTMKHILTLIFTIVAINASAQSFFVNCEDEKSKSILELKVKNEGYKIAASPNDSDYILECKVWQTSKFNSMYKGNLSVVKSGNVIATSSDVRRGAVAVNGFNASANIFEVIARKELPGLLKTASEKQ